MPDQYLNHLLKTMLKHLQHLIIAVALTVGWCGTIYANNALEGSSLHLASDVWPPFTNHFGKPRIAIEIVHLALTRSGYHPSTTILDRWSVPADLKANKYDGCGAIWKSDERADYLLYSKPYLESRLHLVGRKGNDVSITDLSTLKGQRVAIVKDYAYGALLDAVKDVTWVYGNNDVANLKMLINGEADYSLMDDLLIQHVQKEQPEKCAQFLDFGSKPLLIRPLHLALRKNLVGAAEIIKQFNQTIRMMQADGTYNRILRLNSIAIDINGNGEKELVLAEIHLKSAAFNSGYEIYSNHKKLPDQKRYSIRDQLYTWDEIPDDYRSPDDVIPDTRTSGFNLFGGDF